MTARTSAPQHPASQETDTLAGFAFAFGAYFIWGLFPIYFKLLAHVPAWEVILHRMVWSLPVAGIVLLLLRRTADFKIAIRTPRTLLMATVTSIVISINWGVYVWAVAAERVVEAALGYYINPLVNVLVGSLLLGERLSRPQLFSVALATVAVAILTIAAGGLPWVSLVLAFSFAAYGFLRKTLPIGPSQGFFLEVLILSLPATGAILWLAANGMGHFTPAVPADMVLLVGSGLITAVPLLLFAFGAKLLRFTTIGLMQYVAPTMIFLIAVFVFGEPFDLVRAMAFTLIWIALAIYTWSMFRSKKAAAAVPA